MIQHEIRCKSNINRIINEQNFVSNFIKYNEEVKAVEFYIEGVINSDEYIIYQNSEWSYLLVKEILCLEEYEESPL